MPDADEAKRAHREENVFVQISQVGNARQKVIDDKLEADRSEEEGEGELQPILRPREFDAERRKRQNRDEKHDQEHVPHVETVSASGGREGVERKKGGKVKIRYMLGHPQLRHNQCKKKMTDNSSLLGSFCSLSGAHSQFLAIEVLYLVLMLSFF